MGKLILTEGIPPPSQLYLHPGGGLRLSAWSAVAGVTLTLSGRLLTRPGDILPFSISLIPTSNRALSTVNISLPEGYLLSALVRITAGSATRGQLFARVEHILSLTGTIVPLQLLIQDYVTTSSPAGYPGGTLRQSQEGLGHLQFLTIDDPGPGNQFTYTIPTNALYRFIALAFQFTCSANVATRQVRILFSSSAGLLASIASPSTQVANDDLAYQFVSQYTPRDITIWRTEVAPSYFLDAGGSINSSVLLIQANDILAGITLSVEEYIYI